MPTRTSDATWKGDLKTGTGEMKIGSTCGVPFSFATRFENAQGTNPEELIGAAHAGCYSMAFSNELAKAGHTPNKVHTVAKVHFGVTDNGPAITKIELDCHADVPGISNDEFQKLAEGAKQGCPVSKALAATPITLTATLD